jgi:hypothetical protein
VWSIDLVVGSPKFHVEKDGPYVFRSRMFRDGDSLVLAEDITASDGQKAKNTVRYRLEDNGNTLIEDEREETPLGKRRIGGFWSERRIKAERYSTSLVCACWKSHKGPNRRHSGQVALHNELRSANVVQKN